MRRLWLLLGASGRRLLSGLILLVGASFLIYATVRAAPGDAIDAISPPGTPPEIKAKLAQGRDEGPVRHLFIGLI